MNYRIQNFRKVDHQTVKASFDVDFGPVKVRGFNLIETADGGRFISPPSEKYTDKSGSIKFKDIAILTEDLIKVSLHNDIKTLYASSPEPHPRDQASQPAARFNTSDDIPF